MTTAKTQPLLERSEPIDDEYARLLEEISNRLQSGQSPDIDEYCRDYPHYAQDLQQLIPAMEMLGALAGPAASEGGSHQAADAAYAHGQPLGDFQIIREIGRGGMGVVYEAEQLSLGRRVALKVLPLAGMLDERQLQRFKNEAHAAASLHHANIVPVYSVGSDRGVHYYSMQLVSGSSLAEVISTMGKSRDESQETRAGEMRNADCGVLNGREGTGDREQETENSSLESPSGQQPIANCQQPLHSALETHSIAAIATERSSNPRAYFRTAARIVELVAEALEYAHSQGILHRDVKPANILLDAAGKPWITDFGLAHLERGASLTTTGGLIGTLRYMSPEQVAGDGLLDQRTDVYSLGATLYELLTLRPAFPEENRAQLIRRLTDEDPPEPRKVAPAIPRDLETIVLKAMSKQAADRYATAQQLADDLKRFLESHPIRARRPNLLDRATKWTRRHVAAVMGLVALLAISLTVLGVALALVAVEQRAKITAQVAQNTEQHAKIAALEEAQANLAVATDAVDKLYTHFAVEWIANETAPSNLQQEFLQTATDFYRRIIERPAKTARDRLTQATAYARLGELENYLENYEAAVEPLEKSVELTRKSRQEYPTIEAHHDALADRLLSLCDVYGELQDFDKAGAAVQEVLQVIESLPDSKTRSDRLVTCKLQHAHVMQRQGKLDEALRLMVELRDELLKANPTGTYYPLSLIDCRYRIASILLDQDQLSEAEKTHEQAHSQCRGMRGLVYEDSRSLRRTEMDLLVQCGDIAARQGELENAITYYRECLELQRQSFKEQRTPEEYNNAKYAGELSSEPEPGPFARYVETQLCLADVLRRAGRPYDAEMELGSCEYVTRVLVSIARPGALRYRILQANVWAMAAHLAATQDRPDEARGPRRIAARIWLDALEDFPHAADYTSGVHGRHGDLDWFRKSFPGELTENAATPDEADNFRDTPFGRRATGATAFRQDDWQVALGEFARSAQVRSKDQAYDWLHVAICHAQLGHAVQAKNYYEAAAENIAAMKDAPADLLHLADQAKQLVDKLPMPESYYKFDRVFVEPDAHGLAAARQIRIGPDGNVYVASHDTDVVKVFDPDTGDLLRDLGTSGGELDGPWAMVFGPNGRLYVSGRYSRSVIGFDVITGDYKVVVPSTTGGLGVAKGLAFGPDGNLYVSSHLEGGSFATDTVKRYDGTTGTYMGDFVNVGSGGLNGACGLAFAADGNLYIVSANSGAINVYDGITGDFLEAFASGQSAGLYNPYVIEIRGDGFLYVACDGSREIKRIDLKTDQIVELLVPAGTEEPQLVGMSGFAIDDDGRIYVSAGTVREQRGSRVLRYKPAVPHNDGAHKDE